MMFRLTDVSAGYRGLEVLSGVSIDVDEATCVSIVGPNGAGKTTLLRVATGFLAASSGTVTFDGDDITLIPTFRRARRGIGYVPEGRHLLPDLSVVDNLRVARSVGKRRHGMTIDEVFDFFPRLHERRGHLASQMSGGEQQMLAIGRALVMGPRLLVLDEPSTGLSPKIVADVITALGRLRDLGIGILMVEQNFLAASRVSDVAYVMSRGVIRRHGPAKEIFRSVEEGGLDVEKDYFGVEK
jgi:branched-chain amino acid transport system ATP-binding protein